MRDEHSMYISRIHVWLCNIYIHMHIYIFFSVSLKKKRKKGEKKEKGRNTCRGEQIAE